MREVGSLNSPLSNERAQGGATGGIRRGSSVIFASMASVALVVAVALVFTRQSSESGAARGDDDTRRWAASAEVVSLQEFPKLMEAELREVLVETGIDDATPVSFLAADSDFLPLQSDAYGRAAFMYSEISSSNHSWRLYVGKATDTPRSAERFECDAESRSSLLCIVRSAPDGGVLVERVLATYYNQEIENWQLIDLSAPKLPHLATVKLEYSWTRYQGPDETAVIETVLAPATISVDVFHTTASDWQETLADPMLRLPDASS